MRLTLITLALCCAVLSGAPYTARAAENSLRISTSVKPPYCTADMNGYLDSVLDALMRRAGHEYAIVRLPAERAMAALHMGTSDGEMPRIRGLEKQYPGIVCVDEPIIHYNFTAFTLPGGPRIQSWDDLKPFRVAYIIGWKIFETSVPREADASPVPDAECLFRMLREGRVEVVLHERFLGAAAARQEGLVVEASPVNVATSDMFLYLSAKNAMLAAPLAQTLRQLRSEGVLERLAQRTLGASEP